MLSKKKGLQKNFSRDLLEKRYSEKFFRRSPEKTVFHEIFQALHKLLTTPKIVLSSSREQANFRGLEARRVARISQRDGWGFFGSLIQPETNLTQTFISLELDRGDFVSEN